MAKKINYAIALQNAERAPQGIPLDALGASFVSGGKKFYKRAKELSERVPRGRPPEEFPESASATTQARADGVDQSRQKQPIKGQAGKGKAPQGKSKVPDRRGAKAPRNAIASSIRAISTRRGKFGKTKLKPSTESSLKRKGFRVGAPSEIPRRTGQNKPRGRA